MKDITLSIEEKAKAYGEVLKKARMFYKDEHVDNEVNSLLEVLFPELKESEDERIRKELLEHCINRRDGKQVCVDASDYRRWANWLEKQGEQKETLCDKCKKTQPSHSCQDITALGRCALEKQGEYKPTFNIDIPFGAKDSELIKASYYIPEGFHAEIEGNHVVIKKGEQKPAWSEEDNERIEQICEDLRCGLINFKAGRTIKGLHFDEIIESNINWLKSLKPQNRWKPSDKQMKQLGWVAEQNKNNMIGKELMTLYQDLKKLREK